MTLYGGADQNSGTPFGTFDGGGALSGSDYGQLFGGQLPGSYLGAQGLQGPKNSAPGLSGAFGGFDAILHPLLFGSVQEGAQPGETANMDPNTVLLMMLMGQMGGQGAGGYGAY